MKNFIRCVCATFFLLASVFLSAHEGHDHTPVSMKRAVEIALATTHEYTLKQPPFGLEKLDKSWQNLPHTAAKIHENGQGYYVVSVINPQREKTLYLRILLDATVSAASYSDQFVAPVVSPVAPR